MASVLFVVKSGVHDDARIRREAAALRDAGHDVTVVGDRSTTPQPGGDLDGVSLLFARGAATRAGSDVGPPRPWRRAAPIRWALLPWHRAREDRRFVEAVRGLALGAFDVVHAHDFNTLALCSDLARPRAARLVYDAHECWTGRRLEGRPTPLRRRRQAAQEQRLGAAADARITVSEGLARWFADEYGWTDVAVVRNSFPAVGRRPGRDEPRAAVYAGRIDRKRDLETVVAALARVPELELDLVGPADEHFAAQLAAGGAVASPSVAIDELIDRYRTGGIALVPLTDDQTNHSVALPNKLFQAVQAGVPVVAADLPELRRVVSAHGIGTLYTPGDVGSLVDALQRCIAGYDGFVRAVAAAAPALAWPVDCDRLVAVYRSLSSPAESQTA